MRITIEIADEEIIEAVKEKVVEKIAYTIFEKRYNEDGRIYKQILRDTVHAAVRNHENDVLNRAIPIAAEYMGKRGLKKIVNKLTEENEDE